MIKTLNVKTVIQSLFFLQKEMKETNYMALLKHIFFSERYHMRNYGFNYTFDYLVAMPFGSVSSGVKDILTLTFDYFNFSEEDKQYITENIKPTNQYNVSIKDSNDNHLSESIKEALEFSIKNFWGLNEFELANLTHDYPEWKRYECYFKKGNKAPRAIDLLDLFNDPDLSESPYINVLLDGKDPFADDYEFINEMKESYVESIDDC